jgi:general secretion pathway protein B
MSYILDALKRADAERERGAVPGLQSRHAAMPAAKAGRHPQNRLWLAAAALALGGTAAGLWLWQQPSGTERLAAVEPAVATPPPLARRVPPPPPRPAPALPPAETAPRVAASSPPAGARAAPRPVPRPAPAASAVAVQPPPRPRPEPVARAAPTPAAPTAVRLLSDLPEDLRRQIPPLAITGTVYSANPDKRLLLVNNQVLAQGSLAAPGLTLEEIQAKSSVFSFRGTRFRVAH